MGDRGPKLPPIELTEQERAELERWARRRKSAQDLALRARIVLACAEGASNAKVGRDLGVSAPTVTKWRGRFVAHRLDGLSDEPRPGRPRTVTDDKVETVVAATLEAAHTLTGQGHAGRVYPLTGPEDISPRARLRILGQLLGRELALAELSPDEERERLRQFLEEDSESAGGEGSGAGLGSPGVLATVPELTGRPARTFQQWAADHVEAFR